MKKFKFRLEKVLMQRQIVADLAQRSLAEAQMQLNAEIDVRDEMVSVKERSLEERAKSVESTTDWANSVAQINQFLTGQDVRIKRQNERIKETENLVEARREILRHAVSEVKILERLEEKEKQSFMKELNKAEQAEADELTVLRFSRNENLK
ncbi:MAG: flagellar basal body formation protein fliJ [Pseudobdellovibrio sp.]|nr:flagellar basal body formation protein fliJ [Pseudobdellovibrio sp.]